MAELTIETPVIWDAICYASNRLELINFNILELFNDTSHYKMTARIWAGKFPIAV